MLCVFKIAGEMFSNILESGRRGRRVVVCMFPPTSGLLPLLFFTTTCKENCIHKAKRALKGESDGGGVRS